MTSTPSPYATPDDGGGADLQEAWRTGRVFGPPVRLVYRDVVADRVPIPRPPQAALLFAPSADPYWHDDGRFLGDFYSEVLHQDTCDPYTAGAVPLLAALAVDDRVPPRQRFQVVGLLFAVATVTERHRAQCWPDTPPHADPDSEYRAGEAVRCRTADLLARWADECPAVRLALAALAVVHPTARTLPALTPRLQGFADHHPLGTDIGDYVRFVLVLAACDNTGTLDAVESFTQARWRGTARGAPVRARALHLLGRMLDGVETVLAKS
ncbi:hypothetical protein [Streptomyces fructofermentans]|uniref:hypothetical protein n=1 Tax=Streptomyces fructofermentans TaxID=152141 RepID=UPI0037B02595